MLLPHICRRVIDAEGRRFIADSPAELDSALAETSRDRRKVVYYLIHRRPDGSDGNEEVVATYEA
jgi:hypothetical protein